MLNPAGILLLVVPRSFLSSEFWEKSRVATVNRDFSFIGQTQLPDNAFAAVGVDCLKTKIMAFMRESREIEMLPYSAEEFVSMEELQGRISREPMSLGELLAPLVGIKDRPDREEILRNFFSRL